MWAEANDGEMMPLDGKGLAVVLGAAGLGYTLLELRKGVGAMEGQHYVMLLIVLVAGYVIGRIWTQPAQMLGLP